MKSMHGGEPSLSISPSWFRRFTTRRASSRLVCFPFAGAGASAFAGWQSSLEGIEVVGVRLPGREIRLREQRFRDARRAAFSLADAIVQQIEPPFEFFGHSMGALLAYEVCRELERRGAALPRQLIVSARSAPQIPVTSRLYQLADAALLDVIQSYGGTPSDVIDSDYFRRYFLSMIRDDFEMVENYEYNPAPPLNLPIVALAAEEDLVAPLSNVLRWSEATALGFCIHRFPGGHFFIQEEREQVLHCLSSVLER
jgi:medium-chain acyl-[acyl-carrier-protein] hydrolase